MSKITRTLLMTAVLAFMPIFSHAIEFEVDGIYYKTSRYEYEQCFVTKNPSLYSGDVNIPSSVTYDGTVYSVTNITDWAFDGCTGLTSVTIPNTVTGIQQYAFRGCTGLTGITLPNSVKRIKEEAFMGCSNLTNITMSNSLMNIGTHAFDGCSSLTGVTIPGSVTNIGDYAFYGCTSLTSVTIPGSVTSIESGAFSNCENLSDVTNLSITPQEIYNNCFSVYGNLHVLPGCEEAYRNAYIWKNFNIIGDGDVTAVESIKADRKAVPERIYDLGGKAATSLRPGINIVKMSDGTTRKVMGK